MSISEVSLCPIALFVYNRPELTRATIGSLQNNILASQSELYVFSDGWKGEEDKGKVLAVREIVNEIEGFKSVFVIENSRNSGLAKSIIEGVTSIIKKHGSIIVLEDDLATSKNFLCFMNDALGYYEDDTNVLSISGYAPDIKKSKPNDVNFSVRASSWGWATWADRWEQVDWGVEKAKERLLQKGMKKKFSLGGSDLPKMMMDYLEGRISSWAIRFVFHQFITGKVSVVPSVSKVENLGFGEDSTNTKKGRKRYKTTLDSSEKRDFQFVRFTCLDPVYLRDFRKQFSFLARLRSKLFNY